MRMCMCMCIVFIRDRPSSVSSAAGRPGPHVTAPHLIFQLSQVNLDPSLDTDTPLDLRVKPQLLVDLFNVVGMPVARLPLPSNAATAVTAAAAASSAAASSAAPIGLTDMDRWTIELVNAEYERATRDDRWRRLFPCADGEAKYRSFFAPERTRHWLPFELTPKLAPLRTPRPIPAPRADASTGDLTPPPTRTGRSLRTDAPKHPMAWAKPKPRLAESVFAVVDEGVRGSGGAGGCAADGLPATPPNRARSELLADGVLYKPPSRARSELSAELFTLSEEAISSPWRDELSKLGLHQLARVSRVSRIPSYHADAPPTMSTPCDKAEAPLTGIRAVELRSRPAENNHKDTTLVLGEEPGLMSVQVLVTGGTKALGLAPALDAQRQGVL